MNLLNGNSLTLTLDESASSPATITIAATSALSSSLNIDPCDLGRLN